jgi:ATP-dependent exoDNAse (exonuclease V) alpha subunit
MKRKSTFCLPCNKEYSNLKKHKDTKKHKNNESKIIDIAKSKVDSATSEASEKEINSESNFISDYHKFLRKNHPAKPVGIIDELNEKQIKTLIAHTSFDNFLKNPYNFVSRSECETIFDSVYSNDCIKHVKIPIKIIDKFFLHEVKGEMYFVHRLNRIVENSIFDRSDKNDICFTFEYVCDESYKKFDKLNKENIPEIKETKDFKTELRHVLSLPSSVITEEEYGSEKWVYLKKDLTNENTFVNLINQQLNREDRYPNKEEITIMIKQNAELFRLFDKLDVTQQAASLNSLLKPLSLIYGEAGTGKSEVLKFIISFCKTLEKTSDDIKKEKYEKIPLEERENIEANMTYEEKKKKWNTPRPTYSFKLLAPTGIAAKNMSGQGNACTISKYICNKKQAHGATLIIEECGMVHLSAMSNLLKLAKRPVRIIFCGDARQLPPVEGCHMLDAMLRSKLFNHTELKIQHRSGSVIYDNARMIYSETKKSAKDIIEQWKSSPRDKFELFLDSDEDMLANMAIDKAFLMYGKDFDECKSTDDMLKLLNKNNLESQLLSPNSSEEIKNTGKERKTGTPSLNAKLDSLFKDRLKLFKRSLEKCISPTFEDKSDSSFENSEFFKDQRVTVDANIYDDLDCESDNYGELLMARGECGTIVDILRNEKSDKKKSIKHSYKVRFGDKIYKVEEDTMVSGYALTVHRSQGLGFKTVVFVAHSSMGPPQFKTRQLLYTAMTRAKEKFILCTTKDSLEKMLTTENTYGKSHIIEKLIGMY